MQPALLCDPAARCRAVQVLGPLSTGCAVARQYEGVFELR